MLSSVFCNMSLLRTVFSCIKAESDSGIFRAIQTDKRALEEQTKMA